MGNAGRVLMIPKGDYNAATTYEMLDCVYYNGRSYVCKQTSTGNAPTNTTYWQALTGDASSEIQALTNQLTDEAKTRAALGAHNLLDVGLDYIKSINTGGTWTGNVYTTLRATFTINADKSITVTSDGTQPAAQFNDLNLLDATKASALFGDGSYKYSGCASGGGRGKYLMYVNASSSTEDFGNGGAFTNANGAMFIRVYGGQELNLTFKPMITLATDSDPTYQPYAKTNVELTQDLMFKKVSYTHSSNVSIAAGAYADITIDTFSLPTGYSVIGLLAYYPNSSYAALIQIVPKNGSVRVRNMGDGEISVKPMMELLLVKDSLITT